MTEANRTPRIRKPARKPKTAPKSRTNSSTHRPSADAANVASQTAQRAPTKAATVLELLQRPNGASLDELVAATGWLSHTTRAALTGLRKKGHTIGKEKVNGASRYTIAGAAKS